MSVHAAGQEPCDGCGRKVSRIHRVHEAERFCGSCYKRLFVRAMCPQCGNYARLPKTDKKAVCRTCERNRPCVRCGRSGRPIGKISEYGVVCNSCWPHFTTPKACGLCGAVARKLTRVSRLNLDVQVCEKCATQDRGCCQACRRHRLLAPDSAGRMLCKKCLKFGEVACPECDEAMPAGFGKRCQQCYLKDLLQKRIEMDCAAFSRPVIEEHFRAFGQWLGESAGLHNAAMSIHRYLPFFMKVDERWGDIPEYQELLAFFGPLQLRRVLRVMRWMEETGVIVPDHEAKQQEAMRRQIAGLLKKIPSSDPAHRFLRGYYKELQARMARGRTSLRSARLALTPAVGLLLEASAMKILPPNQVVLEKYLDKAAGQRAAVSGFVGYLRKSYEVDIALPDVNDEKAKQRQRRRLEKEMLSLMHEGIDTVSLKRWLSTALAYFHGLPLSEGRKVKEEDVRRLDDGSWLVVWQEQEFWLPEITAEKE